MFVLAGSASLPDVLGRGASSPSDSLVTGSSGKPTDVTACSELAVLSVAAECAPTALKPVVLALNAAGLDLQESWDCSC